MTSYSAFHVTTSFGQLAELYTVIYVDCTLITVYSCVLANPRESTNAQILMCDHHANFTVWPFGFVSVYVIDRLENG
jgi:hypothetical protein